MTDMLMRRPGYQGLQRQNPLGTAFVGLVAHVLQRFGGQQVSYESEVQASTIFPGVSVPGRSRSSRIDLMATTNALPRAVISAKWSMRHDRLSDITNESPVYKAAHQRIYRQSQTGLSYFVVTNEYDPSRL